MSRGTKKPRQGTHGLEMPDLGWSLTGLAASILLALACTSATTTEPRRTRAEAPPAGPGATAPTEGLSSNGTLRPAAAFATIQDDDARAVALYQEAAKVLLHPRCVNCHPAGDQPHQGEVPTLHQPPVTRGPDGFGAVGMRCATCHHDENFDPGRVPGALHWHLAPREMAWEGLSAGDICRQLKDPARNGDRSLKDIVKHMKEDPLVAWGWNPGADREPAPGDQATFGALIAAWAKAGAACPEG